MKKKIEYNVRDKVVKREISYIPIRYIIAALISLLEVLLVIGTVVALCYFVPFFYLLCWITEIVCVIKIIASNDNPDYKIPWLIFVLILPVAGFMLYLIFYSRKLQKKYIKRLKTLRLFKPDRNDDNILSELKKSDPVSFNQAKMLCDISDTHIYKNTKQTYFPSGEKMHRSMLEDLKGAEKFIYLEYFIIEEGAFSDSLYLKEVSFPGSLKQVKFI
jgi:cardiolipin synthase